MQYIYFCVLFVCVHTKAPTERRLFSSAADVTLPELSSVPALVILYVIWDLLVIKFSADASADPVISELLVISARTGT